MSTCKLQLQQQFGNEDVNELCKGSETINRTIMHNDVEVTDIHAKCLEYAKDKNRDGIFNLMCDLQKATKE